MTWEKQIKAVQLSIAIHCCSGVKSYSRPLKIVLHTKPGKQYFTLLSSAKGTDCIQERLGQTQYHLQSGVYEHDLGGDVNRLFTCSAITDLTALPHFIWELLTFPQCC